ncbi:unnamed protein product [Protopolystoma xenopodis]|uniref:Uncharacterized protein n=1 Tax=Protopolystoma xenopodis TaxID=117903 RepID=A0A448X4A4_9PLAT|nr:unnamed protein product [Protopolystoma xenopodis]
MLIPEQTVPANIPEETYSTARSTSRFGELMTGLADKDHLQRLGTPESPLMPAVSCPAYTHPPSGSFSHSNPLGQAYTYSLSSSSSSSSPPSCSSTSSFPALGQMNPTELVHPLSTSGPCGNQTMLLASQSSLPVLFPSSEAGTGAGSFSCYSLKFDGPQHHSSPSAPAAGNYSLMLHPAHQVALLS